MRMRFGGTLIDIKLAGAKLWAFVSLGLFIFSIIYFLSEVRTLDRGRARRVHNQPDLRDDVVKFMQEDQGLGSFNRQNRDAVLAGTGLGKVLGKRPFQPDPGSVDKGAQPLQAPGQQPLKMVMERAKGNYDVIVNKQRAILQAQVRPPDSHYNVNITKSDTISADRTILDTRPEVCRQKVYDISKLSKASVVIPFFNEGLSTLIRTIHSVLNKSPDELLVEVLVVDDKSTESYLGDTLTEYINMLPKTRLIRNPTRMGLIMSRMNGFREATGEVVIFIDAHTEANVGWLEPLLDELQRHPNSVIQPFVDGIDAGSLDYTAPPSLHAGAFSWDLGYRWVRLPEHEAARAEETGYPFFSPTLVGCAIAVLKTYFEHIGTFDEDLKVWGGENTELAFRTWMCNGRVVTVVCSRLGHIFKNFPYKFDGNKEEIVTKNLMRVAETWMDGFRKFFYASTRVYEFKRAEFTNEELDSLKKRISLRQRLGCKNFEWYLHNVIPQVEVPPMDADYYGEIFNLQTQACWEVVNNRYIGMNYLCYEHKIIPLNTFHLSKSGLLKYRDKCIRAQIGVPVLQLGECPASKQDILKHGKWSIINKGHVWGQITVSITDSKGVAHHLCVVQVTNVYLKTMLNQQMPQIGACDKDNSFQTWAWQYKFDWTQVPDRLLGVETSLKSKHFLVE